MVWQPALRLEGPPASPHTFLGMKAVAGRRGLSTVRGCTHSPAAGLAVFGTLPLYLSPGKGQCVAPQKGMGVAPANWYEEERSRGAALGVRLGSDDIAVGFQLDPMA